MSSGYYWYECTDEKQISVVRDFLVSEGFNNVKVGKIAHLNFPFIINLDTKRIEYTIFDMFMHHLERERVSDGVRREFPYIDLMSVIRYNRFEKETPKESNKEIINQLYGLQVQLDTLKKKIL